MAQLVAMGHHPQAVAIVTRREVETVILRVFPGAEIVVYESPVYNFGADIDDTPPGQWIDQLEEQLHLEEEEAEPTMSIMVRLHATLAYDSAGRAAWVPEDYAERYTPSDNLEGFDGDSPFSSAYEPPPIDNVPGDDRTNPAWAEDMIFGLMPDAEIGLDAMGEAVLDTGLHFVGFSGAEPQFATTLDDLLDGIDDVAATDGGTVWERAIAREERRQELRQIARDLVERTDRTLSLPEQLAEVEQRLRSRTDVQDDEMADAVRQAIAALTSNYERPLPDLLDEGESDTIEFKTTALAALPTSKDQSNPEKELVMAVAAMANNDGGVVVVGVHDNGHIVGLADDLKRTRWSTDKFLREVQQKLARALGEAVVAANVRLKLEGDPPLLVVRISPASSGPVDVAFHGRDYFPVRSGPSTIYLTGRDQRIYINEHWGRGSADL